MSTISIETTVEKKLNEAKAHLAAKLHMSIHLMSYGEVKQMVRELGVSLDYLDKMLEGIESIDAHFLGIMCRHTKRHIDDYICDGHVKGAPYEE